MTSWDAVATQSATSNFEWIGKNKAKLKSKFYAGTAHQRVVGVCMSAENTAQQLAELLNVPFGEIAYLAGGINHQWWILRLEHGGQDLYPRLRQIVQDDPDGLGRRVRVEMLKRFGYFPTESSEHNADLVPWFLPHEDQVRRFRIPVNEYLHRSERNLGSYSAETRRKLQAPAGSPWPGSTCPSRSRPRCPASRRA